jgi:hypothetical protein
MLVGMSASGAHGTIALVVDVRKESLVTVADSVEETIAVGTKAEVTAADSAAEVTVGATKVVGFVIEVTGDLEAAVHSATAATTLGVTKEVSVRTTVATSQEVVRGPNVKRPQNGPVEVMIALTPLTVVPVNHHMVGHHASHV